MYPETSIFSDIARNVIFALELAVFIALQAVIYTYVFTLEYVVIPVAEMLRKPVKDYPSICYLIQVLMSSNVFPLEILTKIRLIWVDQAERNFNAMCKDLYELERVILTKEGFCLYEIVFLLVLQFRLFIFLFKLKFNETCLSFEEDMRKYMKRCNFYQVPKDKVTK